MANLTHREPLRNGVAGLPRTSTSDDTPRDGLIGIDDDLRAEMSQLAAANSELMKNIRARHDSRDDSSNLRAENAELRRRVEDLEQLATSLSDAADAEPKPWEERQREYESLLEEKSEVIRALHQKIQELQEEGGDRKDARNNLDMDEVEHLKTQLVDERRRLQEDEEALMAQMREMEMAMSRDRAELSRQRAELQRMHSEMAREVEHASRDSGLRDRLLSITRPKSVASLQLPAEPAPAAEKKQQSSGLFRRLFGS